MMGAVDIVIVVLLAAAVGLAVKKIIKDLRKGGCSCGCANCSGCPGRRSKAAEEK